MSLWHKARLSIILELSGEAGAAASSRAVLLVFMLLLVVPRFFGLTGPELSRPIADLLSFLLSAALTGGIMRELVGMTSGKK